MPRGTVTGLLDTLEKQGLVRRTPHPDDRRMLLIDLTNRGRALVADFSIELFPAQAKMMSVLSERQKDTLVRLLGKLQSHLRDQAQNGGRSGGVRASSHHLP